MADRVVEMMGSPDGQQRILVVQRQDGHYSFRKQWRSNKGGNDAGARAWSEGYEAAAGWGPPGPYLGVYDLPQAAKWEALGRVDWMACALICAGIDADSSFTMIKDARGVAVPDTDEQRDWVIAFAKTPST